MDNERPIMSQSGAEAPIPDAPVAPAARPAPFIAPQPRALNPTVNVSGQRVNPAGLPMKAGDDTVDLDDIFETGKKDSDGIDDIDEPTPIAPKPKAQKPTPQKTEQPAPEPPKEQSPFEQPDVPAPAPRRDYSQLPPEIQEVAKKLPNAVFKHLTETYKNFQTELETERAKAAALTSDAETAKTRATFDHPEAYRLDPEYNELVANFGRANTEIDHYTEQLAAIESGEAWSIITGYDAQGNPQYQQVPAPADGRVDNRAKARILAAMQNLAGLKNTFQQNANNIRSRYADSAKVIENHYAESQKRLFPNLDPDKLTNEQEKLAYKYAIEALPPMEQRRPSAKMLGLAAITVVRMGTQLRDALTKLERYERVGRVQQAAAPVRVTTAPATNDDDDETVSLTDPLGLGAR